MTKHRLHPFPLIQLSVSALAIWLVTGTSFSFLNGLTGTLDPFYAAYCAVVAFLLSEVVVFFLTDTNSVNLRFLGASFINGVLLYFAVNGIQAMYASVQMPDKQEVLQAELIPFLSAKPWLPSLSLRQEVSYAMDGVLRAEEARVNSIDSMSYLLERCGLMADSVFLAVIPNSRSVPSGGKYRAEVVLAAKLDSSFVKRITVNGEQVPFHKGYAVFEETSKWGPGGDRVLDFAAEIQLYENKTKTITLTDSYKPLRTFIEVSAEAVSSLYFNCGNRLNIQVPALGADYSPRFGVEGADFRYGKQKGFITVSPYARRVSIDVFNNGILVGKKIFPVRRVPPPTIKLLHANGEEVDLKKGIERTTESLDIRAIPDSEFAESLPRDASYRVTACEVSVLRDGKLVRSLKDFGEPNILHLIRNASPGDFLEVEVEQVLRKNFKGDVETIRGFQPRVFRLPLR